MKTIQNIRKEARRIHSCELFKGTENEEELIRLFLSPQGQEFCVKNNFPDVTTFKDTFPHATEYGIHIDKGNIQLTDCAMTVLIGNTHAELTYSDSSKRHEVILMHGASATIHAEDWAVVFVTVGVRCKVIKAVKDNALIL
ncbi:MAG: hypothetical protein RR383_08155 [Muribaculaceae bacterium]